MSDFFAQHDVAFNFNFNLNSRHSVDRPVRVCAIHLDLLDRALADI